MLSSDTYLQINSKTNIRISNQGIELLIDKKAINIQGEDELLVINKILPMLINGSLVRDVIAAIPNYDPDDIEKFLVKLIENKAIKKEKSAPELKPNISHNIKSLYDHELGRNNITQEIVLNQRVIGEYKPSFYIASAKYKNPNACNRDEERNWSTGTDEEIGLSCSKAIIESIERYSNGLYNLKSMTFESFESLGKNAVDPRRLIFYLPAQYKSGIGYYPFNKKRKYYWKNAYDLFSKEERLVLADCIYYPYSSGQPYYTRANSSGTATYTNKKTAIKKAISELIEREAFMIVWLNKLSMPKVDIKSLPENLIKRTDHLASLGFKTDIIDITLDLMPVYLAVITSKREGYAFFSGAGSSNSPKEAVDRALTEAETQVYFALMYGPPDKKINRGMICSPTDHGQFYRVKANLRHTNFLISSQKKVLPREEEKESILNMIKKIAKEIIIVDLSLPKSQTGKKLYTVKVFIPEMVPITFGYKEEPLGMKRILTVPQSLGLKTKAINEINTNQPHSFS